MAHSHRQTAEAWFFAHMILEEYDWLEERQILEDRRRAIRPRL
jgi:hypothetical protein